MEKLTYYKYRCRRTPTKNQKHRANRVFLDYWPILVDDRWRLKRENEIGDNGTLKYILTLNHSVGNDDELHQNNNLCTYTRYTRMLTRRRCMCASCGGATHPR